MPRGNRYQYKDHPSSPLLSMMASLMNRVKHNLLNVKISRLVALILFLILVLIIFRAVESPSGAGKGPYGSSRLAAVRAQSIETQRYMDALQDTRPSACRSEDHSSVTASVSIIIHFNEDQFYDAKLTLHSVVVNTPPSQYKEIILLDDGSLTIQKEATSFLLQEAFTKVKVFRTDIPGGEVSSKFKASKLAQGEILVFLSTKTIVNVGWLSPLIKAVQENKNRIATPHVDNFLSGYRFYENKHNLVNVMSLTLGTYYFETDDLTDKHDTRYINNPVLRGDAFALRSEYLTGLGDFDEGIDLGGGEHLELSLRAWLCGGEIKLVPCSRVVTHDALKPLPIENAENVRRITELWLGNLKSIVYNQAKVSFPLHEDEESESGMKIRLRKSYLKQQNPETCHDFDWYHEKIAKSLLVPNSLPRHFGTLADRNGLCIQRKPFHDTAPATAAGNALGIVHCRPHTYDPLKLVEMTPRGQLMMADRCIRVEGSGQVALGRCTDEDAAEKWDITAAGKVFIRGKKELCLTHAMERNRNNELVHYLSYERCQDTREQLWTFTEY